jgi:hypothetical protein
MPQSETLELRVTRDVVKQRMEPYKTQASKNRFPPAANSRKSSSLYESSFYKLKSRNSFGLLASPTGFEPVLPP